MARKRTTPPPTLTTKTVLDRRHHAFWGDHPPPEPTPCIHSETERFPWTLHCPNPTCQQTCALDNSPLGAPREP